MKIETKPQLFRDGNSACVVFRSTRLTFRRDAWNLLRDDGALINVIHPPRAPVIVVSMTKADIRCFFPNVLASRSWIEQGIYNYGAFPAKAQQFVRSLDELPSWCRTWVLQADSEDRTPCTKEDRSQRAHSLPERARGQRHAHVSLTKALKAATSLPEWATAVAMWTEVPPESSAYLEAVRAWRDAWRPQPVRVLLVAESHVGELPGDTEVRVAVPTRPRLPPGYCRLVYCLGYGADTVCNPKPSPNPGTRQFWEMFASIEASKYATQPRSLDEKLRILEALQRRGIWLVDASVTAGYVPGGGRRFQGKLEAEIVRNSWERFVWPEFERDLPQQIWVIGRGVGKALRGHPAIREDRVVVQPQCRDRARYLEDLARMVESIG